jgi:hypothetical protein
MRVVVHTCGVRSPFVSMENHQWFTSFNCVKHCSLVHGRPVPSTDSRCLATSQSWVCITEIKYILILCFFVVFAVWANTSTKRKNAFFIFPQNHVLHRTFTCSAIFAHKIRMSAGHRETFQNRLCFLQTQPRFALSSIQSFSHFHAFTRASNVPQFLRLRNKGRSFESWRYLKQLGTIGIGSTGAKGASWATNGEL